MVCPMRFVLVGFSVVIATFGIFMYNEHTKTDGNNKKVQDQEQRKHTLEILQEEGKAS